MNTIQVLIHAIFGSVKKLTLILSQRLEHVEEEIEQFDRDFMHGNN